MNKAKKDTAVALLNWNGKKWLEKFLPGLIQKTPGAQIYVIDNASQDDSVAYLEKYFPGVQIIRLDKNYGFAGGYNKGLKQIPENYVVLLNTDVEVTPDWLEPLRKTLLSDDKIAAVQPKIKSFRDKRFFEYAGAAGGFLDNLGYPYCDGRIGEKIEEDKGQYDFLKEIQWASGACMLIRKDIFFETGGFDESFFAHQEEIDWAWRARRAGYKIFYTPHSVVYHVGGGSLAYSHPQKTYLNFRNNLLMLLKNLPPSSLFSVIFFRLILDGLAGIMFLLKGKPLHTLAIIKAHFSFYGKFIKVLKNRKERYIHKYYDKKYILLRAIF